MENLQKDWDKLGFGFDLPKRPTYKIAPKDVESYGQLHHLMINLSLNVESAHLTDNLNMIDISPDNLQNDLGRRLLFLCQIDRKPTTVDRHICGEAEPVIAGLLDPENFIPPMIVTRDEAVAGTLKQYADDYYYYALRDDDQSKTNRGYIYRMKHTANVHNIVHPQIPRTSQPPSYRHIDLNSIQHYIGNGRLTFFTLPSSDRNHITVPKYHGQKYDLSLGTDHDTLVEYAESVLEHSESVSVDSESYITNENSLLTPPWHRGI